MSAAENVDLPETMLAASVMRLLQEVPPRVLQELREEHTMQLESRRSYKISWGCLAALVQALEQAHPGIFELEASRQRMEGQQ